MGKGRPPGKPNKVTAELRSMIEGALADAGGRKYLAQQAIDNPAGFMTLVGKLVPRDLNVSGEVKHTLERLIADSYKKPVETEVQPSVQ